MYLISTLLLHTGIPRVKRAKVRTKMRTKMRRKTKRMTTRKRASQHPHRPSLTRPTSSPTHWPRPQSPMTSERSRYTSIECIRTSFASAALLSPPTDTTFSIVVAWPHVLPAHIRTILRAAQLPASVLCLCNTAKTTTCSHTYITVLVRHNTILSNDHHRLSSKGCNKLSKGSVYWRSG